MRLVCETHHYELPEQNLCPDYYSSGTCTTLSF